MITPKTDWNGGTGEFFNISDYARIAANLNEAAGIAGIPEFPFYEADYTTYEMGPVLDGIATQYNQIVDAMGYAAVYPKIEPNRTTWFLWRELNNIEGLCANIKNRLDQIIVCGLPLVYGGGTMAGGNLYG